MLAGYFSTDHPKLKFRWGDASPYNLSTGPNNVSADQKRKVFARHSGLFSAELMGDQKRKKRLIGGKDYKKRFSPGDENYFGDLLLHIYH